MNLLYISIGCFIFFIGFLAGIGWQMKQEEKEKRKK